MTAPESFPELGVSTTQCIVMLQGGSRMWAVEDGGRVLAIGGLADDGYGGWMAWANLGEVTAAALRSIVRAIRTRIAEFALPRVWAVVDLAGPRASACDKFAQVCGFRVEGTARKFNGRTDHRLYAVIDGVL